ncbi:MAG: CdaR family protein, partial [Desulfotomaculaceae bacterium]
MTFQLRDNYIRILSLFIALLLWVYVTNEQNPVTDQTFSVPLLAQGTPRDYVVDGLPATISVRVRGTRIVIGTLQRGDFTARVNLSQIEPGEQEVRVQLTAPPEVEVLQVSPTLVTVQADPIEEKNVPVNVVIKGTVVDGMQAGDPVLEPTVAAVRGPAGVLNEI